jgi:beta-glucosidase-like glycosyl hydrolase
MMRAGLDVDCAFGSGIALDLNTVHSALRLGIITIADVDTALRHLFTVRMRLGHFDPAGPLQRIPETVICGPEHTAVARAGAAQGSSLLKNIGGKTLPLSSVGVGSVAVIGPNGDLSKSIAGYYGAGRVCGNQFYTMVDAIKQYAPNTTFAKGVKGVTSSDTDGIPAAAALAKASDTTVMVLGTDLSTAHEGHE